MQHRLHKKLGKDGDGQSRMEVGTNNILALDQKGVPKKLLLVKRKHRSDRRLWSLFLSDPWPHILHEREVLMRKIDLPRAPWRANFCGSSVDWTGNAYTRSLSH